MADPMTVERFEGEEVILRVENLVKHFRIGGGHLFSKADYLRAVNDVSFQLYRGETVGLVGESGCGKSTLAQTLLRLVEPTSGKTYYKGQDIFKLSKEEMRQLRRNIQIVFQDPYASLNPRMTAGQIISESWKVFPDLLPKKDQKDRLYDLLKRVGLNPGDAKRYPHQFSGGQRQRIGIARALALNPELIICDEPVSALDVSVQAQVINLLEEIQSEFGLSYIFIAHDLSVIRHISDRVLVMYLGKIVESGSAEQVYERPTHPYTQALLSAVPVPNPQMRKRDHIILEGDVPSPVNPPSGCNFRTRCWKAEEICCAEEPEFIDRGQGHPSACFFAEIREMVS